MSPLLNFNVIFMKFLGALSSCALSLREGKKDIEKKRKVDKFPLNNIESHFISLNVYEYFVKVEGIN